MAGDAARGRRGDRLREPAGAPGACIALKVDVDTFEGARRGIPRLLETFRDLGIRASFFLAYGPDNSGKALWKLFRSRGFLRKMLRTRALRLYGLRTALSGTLLPAPIAAERLAGLFRELGAAGHDVGVHGWDHRLWQDRLHAMGPADIAREIERAFAAHERIFASPARAFAAPGWAFDGRVSEALKPYAILYSSSTRFGPPFRPRLASGAAGWIEIPSTVLCPEEILSAGLDRPLFPEPSPGETLVYPAHAEVEGGPLAAEFRAWLERALARGASVVTLEDLAVALGQGSPALPVLDLSWTPIPGRSSPAASAFPIHAPAPSTH
jgi:peptidoglycan/xylan/chitin deacetylase (PgdA/CDA1 family)